MRRRALFYRLPWLADLHTLDEDEQLWRGVLAPDCTILGSLVSGRILAWSHSTLPGSSSFTFFLKGLGLGSALLKRAQDGAAAMSLWTFQANISARRFYEHHGFVPVEQTDRAGNEERSPTYSTAGSAPHRLPGRPGCKPLLQ